EKRRQPGEPGVTVRPPEPQRVLDHLPRAVAAGPARAAVGDVLAEVARPVQRQVDQDRQREQRADDQCCPGGTPPPRPPPLTGGLPAPPYPPGPSPPQNGGDDGRGDGGDEEQEAGVP